MTFSDVEVLGAHALYLDDPQARELVERWQRAALELALFIERRKSERLDLVDASTLAALYLEASAHGR